jgi:hypothetical protein
LVPLALVWFFPFGASLMKVKVSFEIEVDDVEEWQERDTSNLKECIRDSLDCWGDINELEITA